MTKMRKHREFRLKRINFKKKISSVVKKLRKTLNLNKRILIRKALKFNHQIRLTTGVNQKKQRQVTPITPNIHRRIQTAT